MTNCYFCLNPNRSRLSSNNFNQALHVTHRSSARCHYSFHGPFSTLSRNKFCYQAHHHHGFSSLVCEIISETPALCPQPLTPGLFEVHSTVGFCGVGGFVFFGFVMTLRAIERCCLVCRKRKASTLHHLMSELTVEGHGYRHRPFSKSGPEVFGPFYVTFRRSSEKRCFFLFIVSA